MTSKTTGLNKKDPRPAILDSLRGKVGEVTRKGLGLMTSFPVGTLLVIANLSPN